VESGWKAPKYGKISATKKKDYVFLPPERGVEQNGNVSQKRNLELKKKRQETPNSVGGCRRIMYYNVDYDDG
jgi:hypothetical protein